MTDTVAVLGRGRDALVRAAWRDAFLSLCEADRVADLSALDLEALARSAYMVGNTAAYVSALERGHLCYEVDAANAFARQPLGIAEQSTLLAQ